MHADEPPNPAEAFFQAYLEDLRAGRTRTLEDYQRRFPGHPEAIAAAWRECHDDSDGAGPAPDEAGLREQVGPYEIIREIGRGGQGVVYLARDTRLGREVALKVFPRTSSSPDTALRVRREAEALSRLDDRGICSIYELGKTARETFLAMRFVRGRTLAEEIREASSQASAGTSGIRRRLMRTLRLMEEVARSIHKAHAIGIVHRDLKPGNVMIDSEDHAVVLDFGLARDEASETPTLTRTGDVLGTPAYMSPELVSGSARDANARADVYALGVCLYEGLALRKPFSAPTREDLVRQITFDEPEDLRRVDRRIPHDVATIVATAMAKEPFRRYATAFEMAEDLRRAQTGEPVLARRAGAVERAIRWVRRRPLKTALAVAILVAAGLGVYLATRWRDLHAEDDRRRAAAIENALEAALDLVASNATIETCLAGLDAAEKQAGWTPEIAVGRVLSLNRIRQHAKALEALDATRDREPAEPALAWARWTTLRFLDPPAARALRERLGEPPEGLSTLIVELGAYEQLAHAQPELIRPEIARMLRTTLASPVPRRSLHLLLVKLAAEGQDTTTATETAKAMVRLWPDSVTSWIAMGYACQQPDPPRAVAFFRKAMALGAKPVDHSLGIMLANALSAGGDEEASVRAFREILAVPDGLGAIDRELALYNLGDGLYQLGDWDGAIAAGRWVVRSLESRPTRTHAQALCNLGHSLIHTTAKDEGLDALRRGHAMGSTLPEWRLSSAEWVKNAELYLTLAKRLEGRPSMEPPDDDDVAVWQWALAAELAGRHATAARWFRRVYGPDATTAVHDTPRLLSRFVAATAAVHGAEGDGPDASLFDSDARRELRLTGIAWLEQELEQLERQLEAEKIKAARVLLLLQRWRNGPGLAPLRDATAVARFTPAEQERVRGLWERWETLRKRVDPGF